MVFVVAPSNNRGNGDSEGGAGAEDIVVSIKDALVRECELPKYILFVHIYACVVKDEVRTHILQNLGQPPRYLLLVLLVGSAVGQADV